MIEANILEWIELGDSIQRIDLYNKKKNTIFKASYLLLQYGEYSQFFYLFIILLYFGQIWEMNLLKIINYMLIFFFFFINIIFY